MRTTADLNICNHSSTGEPGVGKTAVAEGLAQRIISGDVPSTLKGRRLMSLDMGALVAGEDVLRLFLQCNCVSSNSPLLILTEPPFYPRCEI